MRKFTPSSSNGPKFHVLYAKQYKGLRCCNMSYEKSLISLHQRYLPNKPKELDENILMQISFFTFCNMKIFFRVNKITWGNNSFSFILTTSHLKRFIWTS